MTVRAGLDLMMTPVVPVNGFDMLSSTFNKPLLVIIVVGLSAAALVLRSFVQEKQLKSRWK